jgi:hypothetical protein
MEPILEFIGKDYCLLMNYSEHGFEQCFCAQKWSRVRMRLSSLKERERGGAIL